MYKAEIIADSLCQQGYRLTTMKITFPRIVLAEFNTHRVFSRNSASSRAIPFKKMVKMVKENPFIPIAWQKDHKGMQGTEYLTGDFAVQEAKATWLIARDKAINEANNLNKIEATKQLCNRLLEPFMWHTVIVTATEWENFFALRCPLYELNNNFYRSKKDWIKAYNIFEGLPVYFNQHWIDKAKPIEWWLNINKSQADIHIQAIAELMWDTYNESTPKQLQAGEWHTPFGDNIDDNDLLKTLTKVLPKNESHGIGGVEYNKILLNKYRKQIAAARCARISYETLGDDPKIDYEADLRLHNMLLESQHMSPFEHVARAMSDQEYYSIHRYQANGQNEWCKNFRGFIQYRHLVEQN